MKINKFFFCAGIVFSIFIVGCQSANHSVQSEIDVYDVEQSSDVKMEGDFSFRLVSEKEEYAAGEEVKLYGELRYIGDKDKVTIAYGDTAISFTIEEKVRDYLIGDIIKDIGVERRIKRYELYRVKYAKNKFYMEVEDEGYNAFMEQFVNEDGFPPGYYVVQGTADFAYDTGHESGEMEPVKIELEIDFKVNHE